jgi:hypothetical protein
VTQGNIIKLKDVSKMGTSLLPGEVAIDETGRKLYFDKTDGSGPKPIDLNAQPVPVIPRNTPPDAFLIWGLNGPEWLQIERGGGGFSYAASTGWFIPGQAFLGGGPEGQVCTATSAARYKQTFFVPLPVTVRHLMIRPVEAAAVNYTWGIEDATGTSVFEQTNSTSDGEQIVATNLLLDEGNYRTYLYCAANAHFAYANFRPRYYLTNPPAPDAHFIWLRLD